MNPLQTFLKPKSEAEISNLINSLPRNQVIEAIVNRNLITYDEIGRASITQESLEKSILIVQNIYKKCDWFLEETTRFASGLIQYRISFMEADQKIFHGYFSSMNELNGPSILAICC